MSISVRAVADDYVDVARWRGNVGPGGRTTTTLTIIYRRADVHTAKSALIGGGRLR